MSASFLSHLHSLAEGKRRNNSQLAVLSGVHGPAFQMPDNIFPREPEGNRSDLRHDVRKMSFPGSSELRPERRWFLRGVEVNLRERCSGFTPGETSSTSSVSSPRGKCSHARSQPARLCSALFCIFMGERH